MERFEAIGRGIVKLVVLDGVWELTWNGFSTGNKTSDRYLFEQ